MTRSLHDIDVASSQVSHSLRLNRVGMSNIEAIVLVPHAGTLAPTSANIDAFVSLDQPQKGIHMSRLFLMVQEVLAKTPLSPSLLGDLTKNFLATHVDVSKSAHVRVNFSLMLQRSALLSGNKGWRQYPVSLWATHTDQGLTYGVDLTVKYSSTCPCSAALARQLNQARFAERFAGRDSFSFSEIQQWLGLEDSVAGTPHGQRSEGRIRTELLTPTSDLSIVTEAINALEVQLSTPVQAAVKRADEQEFARVNAANLMFAEDAVRRMHDALVAIKKFSGFAIEAAHLESLHAHDAIARIAVGSMRDYAWH